MVGIDKSKNRLEKNYHWKESLPENILLLRSDIYDFWQLLNENNIAVEKHFVLFPNPWPKKQHLKRRIHAHPAFIDMLNICCSIELRSNWKIYLQEMEIAVNYFGGFNTSLMKYLPESFITPFERKYHKSGQELYLLTIERNDK